MHDHPLDMRLAACLKAAFKADCENDAFSRHGVYLVAQRNIRTLLVAYFRPMETVRSTPS